MTERLEPIAEPARFAVGVGEGEDWRAATEQCAAALSPQPGANLGFVYFSDHLASRSGEILDLLSRRTGVAHWLGTAGIGVLATGRELFDRPAVVAMLADLPDGAFRLLAVDDTAAGASEAYFGVVHCDPGDPALTAKLTRLADDTNSFLVGGLTAARTVAVQLLADGKGSRQIIGGISGALFDDTVSVITGLTQGCSPIGPMHEITDGGDGLIQALDGRPAFEIFNEEIGEVLARNLKRVAGYIFAAVPVSGVDRPDYLVRNLIALDPANGTVAIAEPLQAGDRVMFCRRDSSSARADLTRMLEDLGRRAGDRRPRGALYFSCLGRGPNMFGEESAELRLIEEHLGDVPLVGFFCNGEIANGRLYTYTGVMTLFF